MDQSPSNPMGGLSEGCKAIRQAMIAVCNQRADYIAAAESAKTEEERAYAFFCIRYCGKFLAHLNDAHQMVLDRYAKQLAA